MFSADNLFPHKCTTLKILKLLNQLLGHNTTDQPLPALPRPSEPRTLTEIQPLDTGPHLRNTWLGESESERVLGSNEESDLIILERFCSWYASLFLIKYFKPSDKHKESTVIQIFTVFTHQTPTP